MFHPHHLDTAFELSILTGAITSDFLFDWNKLVLFCERESMVQRSMTSHYSMQYCTEEKRGRFDTETPSLQAKLLNCWWYLLVASDNSMSIERAASLFFPGELRKASPH